MSITLLGFAILAFTIYEVSATFNFTREVIWYDNKTERAEWPFLAALFKDTEEEKMFFCFGSLITSKTVLTGTVKCTIYSGEF